MDSLTGQQIHDQEVKQMQSFLSYYNRLTELCFSDCVHDFTNRRIAANENNCAMHCTEKSLKVIQRVGVRLQEVQIMQNEALMAGQAP
ncbi:mitochondrial import inner membrane translocase subunit Tim9 [Exaiptasia diaphana]|uniref:Mitochondrial import inner membrane translocase subunit n=1 Tax=Exaiptasia diaphana TaxID=2652724 RepID=A0A913Y0M5_EXADI|nr:mitochondrial import inner membrane translocase subunit Tim9 [Exaiptasia diaphana]KXJ19851.1 Mitochondrial import inner membrane translocase subunit Tim9 [Exaiptasia diaphana]